jgi:hypothetical protein
MQFYLRRPFFVHKIRSLGRAMKPKFKSALHAWRYLYRDAAECLPPMVSQRNQQVDVRKATVDSRSWISLELLCFQQVYVQQPQVAVQHPFWGDVSSFSRCEAAFLKTQTKPDPSGRPPTNDRAPCSIGT